jgi:hypothetical protein
VTEVARYAGFLEMDLDGETVLGTVYELATKEVIAIHSGNSVEEVYAEVNEFLSECFWDYDQELHITWTAQVPQLSIIRKFMNNFARELGIFEAAKDKGELPA